MDILCITSVVRLQCILVTCATVVLTRLSMKTIQSAFFLWTPQIFDSFHPQGSFSGCEMKVVLVVIVLKLAENFFSSKKLGFEISFTLFNQIKGGKC